MSVWGESAGGGSLLHHLVAFGGKEPAPFKRAIVMSPAIVPSFDRPGQVEKEFQDFASMAGCRGQGISCLRGLKYETLKAAQDKYIKQGPPGTFAFGYVQHYVKLPEICTDNS